MTNILTTGKTHTTFTHSVRARKVEFKGMRTSLEGDLGKTLFFDVVVEVGEKKTMMMRSKEGEKSQPASPP